MTNRTPRRWWKPAAAVAAAVAVLVLVVIASPLGDPGSDGTTERPTGDPVATPSPTDAPTPSPSPTDEPTPSPTEEPTPSPTAAAECSAAGLPAALSAQPELPDGVAELRDEIARHAVACDLEGLVALAAEEFTYSFGGGDDPAGFWRAEEEDTTAEGPKPMEALRLLLDTPPGTETAGDGSAVYWAWPRLHVLDQDAPQEERDAAMEEVVATGLYTREQLEDMYELVGGYIGYRVVIEVADDTGEPSWTAFVAGD